MCKTTVQIVGDDRRMHNIDEVRARVGLALQIKPEYKNKILEGHGCLCPVDIDATAEAAGFRCIPQNRAGIIEWFTWGTRICKICGGQAREKFRLPVSKKTGHAIPDLPDDCPYYECSQCHFCFSTHLDKADHTKIYDETYWNDQDPDWSGRVSETLRLVLLSNQLVKKMPYELEILDFGCGMGAFIDLARRSLQLDTWGTDIVPPKFGRDFFLPVIERKFDIVVSCEVIEHIPNPMETFQQIKAMLKPDGVFAFQTAQYDPTVTGRDWWYVGPDNGHISLYSREALDYAFKALGGKERLLWRGYPGVQAWQF